MDKLREARDNSRRTLEKMNSGNGCTVSFCAR